MRGMIVAAGLGTRMRPLSDLRPKPALPVRGIPLVAYQMALLAQHGVREIIINAHAQAELLIEAARRFRPDGVELHFSIEPALLDTGGGIRRAAAFLRESDPCLILGGDMLLDADLTQLVRVHRERRDAATLLLLDDPRSARFGSIGLDAEGCIRRIGRRFDLGGETRSGLYVWANVFAARAFDSLPEREVFSHLDHWIAPRLVAGARDLRGVVATPAECRWLPVGTPAEYLHANFAPIELSYLDPELLARGRGARFEPGLVLGAGAELGAGARLERCVVWDGESVPAGFRAHDGVFAGGRFHACSGAGADALD